VKLLRFMTHPNIIAMRDIYVAPTPDGGEDVYIVMQKMGADLKRIVQVQVLSDPHVQHITYHITKAIAYVQSAGIMHRDLKPENIAMNENMELRVLDFGMARGVNQTTGAGHTGYVVSRHYRAPEVLCFEFDAERLNYTEGVDSWALGCIIAEQITGQVLFHGSNFIEQLAAIAEKLGRPPAAFVGAISNEDVRAFTMSLPEQPSQPLPAYFTANNSVGFGPINPQAIDLVAKLLVYDPGDRLKARDALDHPYFVDIRDEATETRSQVKFDESFEHMNLNVRGWRELFMMELLAVKAGGVGVGGAAAAAAAGAAAAVAVTAGQPQPQSAVM
jgi:p38 MAP kinase